MADHPSDDNPKTIDRRSILKIGLGGACLGTLSNVIVLAQGDPAMLPPQEGDLLVKLDDASVKPLGVADVAAGAIPLMAWPMDPVSKTVRKGIRLNEILLVRLASPAAGAQPDPLSGVVAFSGLCTHSGCDVTSWVPATSVLSCDCHQSEFDARAAGRVVGGPAARALPPLALKLDGDLLVVAKPFATTIRFDE